MTEFNLSLTFLFVFQVLFLGGILYFAPGWTRRGLFLTVTVEPDFSASSKGQEILGLYRRRIVLLTVASLGITLGAMALSNVLVASLVSGVQALFGFGCLLAGRRHVKPYSREASLIREASLSTHPDPIPGGFFGQAGPFLVLFAVAVFLASAWDSIPESFATHWGPDGEADAWTQKSPFSVTMPLVFGAGLCAMIQWLAYSLLTHARRVDTVGLGSVTEAARRGALARALLVASFFMALFMGSVSLMPFLQLHINEKTLGLATLLASIVGSIGLMIYLVASLVPHFTVKNRHKESSGDRSPDSRWKLGVLYFAPDDPAIWVEKRFGIGYTMNLAQPIAWANLGLLVCGPLLLSFVWAAYL